MLSVDVAKGGKSLSQHHAHSPVCGYGSLPLAELGTMALWCKLQFSVSAVTGGHADLNARVRLRCASGRVPG